MGVEGIPAGAPSAFTIVPGAMRERIHDRAADSEANTAGTEWPLRSRTMMTERRLPFWLRAKRRSRRFSLWLAGF